MDITQIIEKAKAAVAQRTADRETKERAEAAERDAAIGSHLAKLKLQLVNIIPDHLLPYVDLTGDARDAYPNLPEFDQKSQIWFLIKGDGMLPVFFSVAYTGDSLGVIEIRANGYSDRYGAVHYDDFDTAIVATAEAWEREERRKRRVSAQIEVEPSLGERLEELIGEIFDEHQANQVLAHQERQMSDR